MSRRKATAKRNKKGKIQYPRPRKDFGTPELAMRRAELTGMGDPALSTTALGILFAHGFIDRDEYDAGETYAKLYCKAFGKPFPRAGQMSDLVHSSVTTEYAILDYEQNDAKKKYFQADKHLRKQGEATRRVVFETAVESIIPAWWRYDVSAESRKGLNQNALNEGLRVLQEVL